jgi:hypothetical protein
MTISTRACPFLILCLHLQAGAGLAQQTYRLDKKPSFQVGDVIVCRPRGTAHSAVKFDGNLVRKQDLNQEMQLRSEVLGVDENGWPVKLRHTIVSKNRKAEGFEKGIDLGKLDEQIEDITWIARVDENRKHHADTETITSRKTPKLTAQKWLLVEEEVTTEVKDYFWSPQTQVLLPSGPVAVGKPWKISDQALAKANDILDVEKITFLSGQGVLNKVHQGQAEVRLELKFKSDFVPNSKSFPAVIEVAVDLKTGRCLKEHLKGTLDLNMQHLNIRQPVEIKIETEVRNRWIYEAGSGKVSPAPAETYKLGWKDAGQDKNNTYSAPMKLSIDLPKGFIEASKPSSEDPMHMFAHPDDMTFVVTRPPLSWAMPFKQFSEAILKKHSEGSDVKAYGQREMRTLADGRPCYVGKIKGNGYQGYMAMALPDFQSMQIFVLLAPEGDEKKIRRISDALNTLRLDVSKPKEQ